MPKGCYPRTPEHLERLRQLAENAGEARWGQNLGNERNCVYCGKALPLNRWRYCNDTCKSSYLSVRYREQNPFSGQSTSTTGAISELRVAVDLMSKGYNVFRALSPSCPCDLAILKDGQLLKIEVRTTYRTASGKIYRSVMGRDNPLNIDHYAWVLSDKIVYEPPLPKI